MNEGRVTIDGITRELPRPFIVIATQNATHATGTFPPLEPQLDRFLLSLGVTLPDAGKQTETLLSHAARGAAPETIPSFGLDWRNDHCPQEKCDGTFCRGGGWLSVMTSF